jgi:hypothetical protein
MSGDAFERQKKPRMRFPGADGNETAGNAGNQPLHGEGAGARIQLGISVGWHQRGEAGQQPHDDHRRASFLHWTPVTAMTVQPERAGTAVSYRA